MKIKSITVGIRFLIFTLFQGMRARTLVNPGGVRDRIVSEARGLIANLNPKTNTASTALIGKNL
jgi:hypothetical protein